MMTESEYQNPSPMNSTCGTCKHHISDPYNKQDAGMLAHGYKPCALDQKSAGAFYHMRQAACKNYAKAEK